MLVDRANTFLATHPGAEAALRRVLTLRLATVREDGEPTRRRAARAEFSDEEWRLVSELADYPNRLLITATSEAGETYAEVAHEAIFRRWDKLREWIAAEREFLAWRSGLETARRAWESVPMESRSEALLGGLMLAQARAWLEQRPEDLLKRDREFIEQSIARDRKTTARARRTRALIYVLLVGVIFGLIGWINQSYIKDQVYWFTTTRPYAVAKVWPYVLTTEVELALKPLTNFRECANDCPEMIVIPAGEFMMGSPDNERGRNDNEGPQHKVTIARPFAASKFDVTFADYDVCTSLGWCAPAADNGFGRGTKPVIHVNWHEAQQYVAWLSEVTGRNYRIADRS